MNPGSSIPAPRNGQEDISVVFNPFAGINESKEALQKVAAIHIIEKLVVFSDRAFEKKFIESLERNLGSRLFILGISGIAYSIYTLLYYPRGDFPHGVDTAPLTLFRIGGICLALLSAAMVALSVGKRFFRTRLEWIVQYLVTVALITLIILVDPWRATALTMGRGDEAAAALPLLFKNTDSLNSSTGIAMLLTGCVMYLAVVMDMRFRRLIWICVATGLVFMLVVLLYKYPECTLNRKKHTVKCTTDDKGAPKNLLTPLQLLGQFLVALYGKIQLEMLQRRNFLELNLAELRIDILEKTIHAMGREGAHASRSEDTQKKLKQAERILEKFRHLKGLSSAEIDEELFTVIEAIRQTSKTITILDFQKEVLIGPIRTGIEYNEEDISRWLQSVAGQRQVDRNDEDPPPGARGATLSRTATRTDEEFGVSAKSLTKQIGFDWNLNPSELEKTLNGNRSTNLSAFGITARALLSPLLSNVLNGVTNETLSEFITVIENGYLNVPFHNADRAALVAHHAACLMNITGIRKKVSGIDRLAMVVASLCVDVNHFGRSNSFLVDSKHELAVRYNDVSVLENLHASKTFELMRSGRLQTDISAALSPTEERRFRSRVIELILSTDQSHHFSHMAELSVRLISRPDMYSEQELLESDRRITLIGVMIAANLSSYAIPFEGHKEWANRLAEELALQGDDERTMGLPISPMCDREMQKLPNMMSGMLDMLVIPIYKEITELAEHVNGSDRSMSAKTEIIIGNLHHNRENWEGQRRMWGSQPSSRVDDMDKVFVPKPVEKRKSGSISMGSKMFLDDDKQPLLGTHPEDDEDDSSHSSSNGEPPLVSFDDVRKL
jgi:hypothetical protein